ncbi:MAG: hypothetical protein LBB79_02655, partial [Prevotellaceae bacterium]|nr:hypothetical protein [Prevotellaceae bacterium]
MKTILKHLLLLAVVAAGSGNVWGEVKTITITVESIKNGGGTLGSNNYNSGIEKAWTQDGVSFGGKAITEGNSSNTGNIQAQANNGVLYNTTELPGKIVSIELHSIGTTTSSCYGGTSRLVNNTAGDYAVSKGTQVGSASPTGWTATDFNGTAYSFFAIKRGTSVAYWSSIVITYDIPDPAVTWSPSALAFSPTLIGSSDTLKLNVKGVRLTNDVTVSVSTDTAGVFSVLATTVTAEETMSIKGKSIDIVFTPKHTYSYGGTLRFSSADFADTTLALTGTGGEPTISTDSAQVRFGSLAQGNNASKNIKVSSQLLTDSISVSLLDSASGFFSVSPVKLAPNKNTTIAVSYAPTTTGDHATTLCLQSGVQTCNIPLSGSSVSLLLTENFEYEIGQNLTDNGWTANSGVGTSPIAVASGLTFGGYAASGTGGAAAIVNNGEDVSRQFGATVTSGKIYMAFMLKTE